MSNLQKDIETLSKDFASAIVERFRMELRGVVGEGKPAIDKVQAAREGIKWATSQMPSATMTKKPKPTFSAAARKRISDAQKARWAKIHAAAKKAPEKKTKKK